MPRALRALVGFVALTLGSGPELAGQSPYIFGAGQETGAPGSTVSVPFTLDNNGNDAQGWSYGVCNDPGPVTPVLVDSADSATVNGGAPPGFLDEALYPNGFTQGVVVSLIGANVLPAGTQGFVMAITDYDIAPNAAGGLTPLDYCATLGTPNFSVVIVVGGASFAPTTLSGSIEISSAAPAFIRGDANDDGVLNIGDVVWLLNELFVGGSPRTDCPLADDANADGLVNIADAITLLEHLFGGAPPPSPPFPDCGTVAGTMPDDCPEAMSCP